MGSIASFPLYPVGVVETTVPDREIGRRRRDLESAILVHEQYADALLGIDDYSHLIVLFWMHRSDRANELVTRPRGDPSLPLTGVFASRGRNHPNPIGLAVVDLIRRDANRLSVRRLDAYNGTPVIDLKPYDSYDVFTDLKVPRWLAARAAGAGE